MTGLLGGSWRRRHAGGHLKDAVCELRGGEGAARVAGTAGELVQAALAAVLQQQAAVELLGVHQVGRLAHQPVPQLVRGVKPAGARDGETQPPAGMDPGAGKALHAKGCRPGPCHTSRKPRQVISPSCIPARHLQQVLFEA